MTTGSAAPFDLNGERLVDHPAAEVLYPNTDGNNEYAGDGAKL